jgi:WD40 repeat-containing protein SMU1
MSLEIDSRDVIKLIGQFLKENGLTATLATMQQETAVTMNTVVDEARFVADITGGRWDAVLEQVALLSLPTGKVRELYEQIFLEMAEARELDTARALLRTVPPMSELATTAPVRHRRLEAILQKTYFDPEDGYPPGIGKEQRRKQIAEALRNEVTVVAPSRLLALLTQSLKWQQYVGQLPKGSRYDLFAGSSPAAAREDEKFPTRAVKQIKFGSKSHCECAAFSPDGQFFVTGSVDGFVEVWDFDNGKLRKDLPYQAEDEFMMHTDAVRALAFSRDSALLATGSASGEVKVWRLATGSCVRRFETAHTGGVTSLQFSRDGTQILSASHDQTARVHGLKSGRTLKEFRGHTSFVNAARYHGADGEQVITVSSDGNVKVWDARSGDCVRTFKPDASSDAGASLVAVAALPSHADRFLFCSRSKQLHACGLDGGAKQTYTSTGGDLIAMAHSPKGGFVFGVGDDSVLYCFAADTGVVEHVVKMHAKEVLGVVHHPHKNLIASYSVDGTVKLWKP